MIFIKFGLGELPLGDAEGPRQSEFGLLGCRTWQQVSESRRQTD